MSRPTIMLLFRYDVRLCFLSRTFVSTLVLTLTVNWTIVVTVLARMLLAADIESDEFEGVDEGAASFVNRENTNSKEGAKDPYDSNNDPACQDRMIVSVS